MSRTEETNNLFAAADSESVPEVVAGLDTRCLIWCRSEQAGFVSEVASAASLRIVGLGCPGGSGAIAGVVERAGLSVLNVTAFDDPRQGVQDMEHDLLLLLTLDEIDPADVEGVLNRARAGILVLEPLPAGISDCTDKPSPESVWLVPLMRRGRAMALLDQVREQFGPVRSMSVTMRCRPTHGSLYARLTDAVDMVERMCGEIEMVDAAMSVPAGMPTEAPQSLRALRGCLTLNARFAENRCACIHVSNMGAVWSRGVTILGDNGSLRITDEQFEWCDPEGRVLDHAELIPDGSDRVGQPAGLLADQIDWAVDPHRRQVEPRDVARTVAVCEATRLSLATCACESPRKLLKLIR